MMISQCFVFTHHMLSCKPLACRGLSNRRLYQFLVLELEASPKTHSDDDSDTVNKPRRLALLRNATLPKIMF